MRMNSTGLCFEGRSPDDLQRTFEVRAGFTQPGKFVQNNDRRAVGQGGREQPESARPAGWDHAVEYIRTRQRTNQPPQARIGPAQRAAQPAGRQ